MPDRHPPTGKGDSCSPEASSPSQGWTERKGQGLQKLMSEGSGGPAEAPHGRQNRTSSKEPQAMSEGKATSIKSISFNTEINVAATRSN